MTTLALSIITLLIVNFLSNYAIIYGRRRFALMIIISFIIRLAIERSVNYFPIPEVFLASSIGYIIPGIIAQDLGRQGPIKTLSSMAIVTVLVRLADIIIVNGGFL